MIWQCSCNVSLRRITATSALFIPFVGNDTNRFTAWEISTIDMWGNYNFVLIYFLVYFGCFSYFNFLVSSYVFLFLCLYTSKEIRCRNLCFQGEKGEFSFLSSMYLWHTNVLFCGYYSGLLTRPTSKVANSR